MKVRLPRAGSEVQEMLPTLLSMGKDRVESTVTLLRVKAPPMEVRLLPEKVVTWPLSWSVRAPVMD